MIKLEQIITEIESRLLPILEEIEHDSTRRLEEFVYKYKDLSDEEKESVDEFYNRVSIACNIDHFVNIDEIVIRVFKLSNAKAFEKILVAIKEEVDRSKLNTNKANSMLQKAVINDLNGKTCMEAKNMFKKLGIISSIDTLSLVYTLLFIRNSDVETANTR